MKLLLLGANGQLGWELCGRARAQGFECMPLDLAELDIANRSAVRKQVKESQVSFVINAAAYTAVDRAESEPELALRVNREGPANLALACSENEIPLLHISTDYVFDGTKKGPYLETDTVSPLGVYGRSKAEGETRIRDCLAEHVILRTSWLYGVHGHNFVKTMLRLGKEKAVLKVVNDQYGCPTYAADLAEAILAIGRRLEKDHRIAWGTYHYCGKGQTTWHGFAEKIFELAKERCPLKVRQVLPITTAEYPTPSRRPANSVLDCSRLTETFGIHPSPWQESLAEMLDRLPAGAKDWCNDLDQQR